MWELERSRNFPNIQTDGVEGHCGPKDQQEQRPGLFRNSELLSRPGEQVLCWAWHSWQGQITKGFVYVRSSLDSLFRQPETIRGFEAHSIRPDLCFGKLTNLCLCSDFRAHIPVRPGTCWLIHPHLIPRVRNLPLKHGVHYPSECHHQPANHSH